MLTHCYFDMLDTCIAFDQSGVQVTHSMNARDYIVLGGAYVLDAGLNPLDMSAEELFPFSLKTMEGCTDGSCGI